VRLRPRAVFAVLIAAALAALVVWAVTGVTPFGRPAGPADAWVRTVAHQRHAANAVNGITYDLRGLDTLGEELILFVAALGTAVLLRHGRGEQVEEEAAEADERRGPRTADLLRASGAALVGPVIVLGLWLISHGHLGPGGGFQGGILLAGGLLLVYAAGQVLALARLEPTALVEVADAVGAMAYALIAIGGLVFAGTALFNFLPFGTTSMLLSSGTIAVLSVAVGVEVTGAVALIITEFLDQTLLRGRE
jgi:multicomponent Na+:H+ antiporter subunit B